MRIDEAKQILNNAGYLLEDRKTDDKLYLQNKMYLKQVSKILEDLLNKHNLVKDKDYRLSFAEDKLTAGAGLERKLYSSLRLSEIEENNGRGSGVEVAALFAFYDGNQISYYDYVSTNKKTKINPKKVSADELSDIIFNSFIENKSKENKKKGFEWSTSTVQNEALEDAGVASEEKPKYDISVFSKVKIRGAKVVVNDDSVEINGQAFKFKIYDDLKYEISIRDYLSNRAIPGWKKYTGSYKTTILDKTPEELSKIIVGKSKNLRTQRSRW